ncbi:plasmid pRiA4b ORF-3 family protein [Cryobacterium psychrotolerans]|uniref:plasmid pRiA4b ORF-3 family protein n=1 Tax=Cryobacterium psychrotolerans TaxID=386301 RepID=UPI0014303753|nr:plasmid pRiA4b ORF-3 family protein [Cryobacterium psychrotolerans]
MIEQSNSGPSKSGPPTSEPDNVIDLEDARRRFLAAAADSDADSMQQAMQDASRARRDRPKKPLPLLTPPATPVRFRVRVDLVDSKPPIWRRLSLPSNLALDRLHDVLQTAFGWTNSHLHQFTLTDDPHGEETVGILTPFDVEEGDVGVLESELRLDQFLASTGDTLRYTYDFGDNWEHTVTLEAVEAVEAVEAAEPPKAGAPTDATVRCLAGRRLGPPEDIGGMHSYEQVLAAALNPRDPAYSDLIETIAYHDLFSVTDDIDLDAINRGLDRLAGADAALAWLRASRGGAGSPIADLIARVGEEAQRYLAGFVASARLMEPLEIDEAAAESATLVIRTFLRHVGDGLQLSKAGFLQPAAVIALMAELDPDKKAYGKANREANTRPLLDLRQTVTELGLVRKRNGMLLPTKLGLAVRESPLALWRHIASRLPVERQEQASDAALLLLLLVAAGEVGSFIALGKSLDLVSAVAGMQLEGNGRYGNGSAVYKPRHTREALEWAASGTLADPRPFRVQMYAPSRLDSIGAQTLARAALTPGR